MNIIHLFERMIFTFKFLILAVYLIFSMSVLLLMYLYPYTQEMIQACRDKAHLEDPTGAWVGFECYFNPLAKYLIILNLPGIYIFERIDRFPGFSDFKSSLPNNVEYLIGDLTFPLMIITSVAIYILIGHLIDLLIRRIKRTN